MNAQTQKLWAQCVIKHTATPMNWQNVADEFSALLLEEAGKIADGYGTWQTAELIATAIRKLK